MRRSVYQTVAGNYSIVAGTTDPVVGLPTFPADVHKLYAGAGSEEVLVRCLGSVAAMVEPVSLDIRRELSLHLPSLRIPSCKDSRMLSPGDLSAPNEAVYHHQVFGRAGVTGGIMRSLPKQCAVPGGQGPHFTLQSAVGKEDHIIIYYERRAVNIAHAVPLVHRFRLPSFLARLSVQAYNAVPVVEIDALIVSRQSQRLHRILDLPQHLSRLGVEGYNVTLVGLQKITFRLLHCPIFLVPAYHELWIVALRIHGLIVFQQE